MQLVMMKSPKGQTYSILPSRVYAKLSEGWNLVDKNEQAYYKAQAQRIRSSVVVHSR